MKELVFAIGVLCSLAGMPPVEAATTMQRTEAVITERMKFNPSSAGSTTTHPEMSYNGEKLVVINTSPYASDYFKAADNSNDYQDFDVEATVYIKDGSQGSGNGIFFRGSTDMGTGFFLFNITRDGRVGFYIYNNGNYTYFMTPQSKILHPAVKAGAPNKLKAEVHGNTIKLFVNGQLIKDITDSWRQNGSVGLYVSGGNTVEYSDFTVKASSSKPLVAKAMSSSNVSSSASKTPSSDTSTTSQSASATSTTELGLPGFKDKFLHPYITPDNKAVITIGKITNPADRGAIEIRSLSDGSLIKSIDAEYSINDMAFSQVNGSGVPPYIAVACSNLLRIYSYPAGLLVKEILYPVTYEGEWRTINNFVFSTKGDKLAFSIRETYSKEIFFIKKKIDDSKIIIMDLKDWSTKELLTTEASKLAWTSDDKYITGIFNPSDSLPIITEHSIVKAFNAEDGTELVRPEVVYGAKYLAAAGNNSKIVTAAPGAGIAEVWSIQYKRPVKNIKYRWGDAFKDPVFAVSRDGQFLAMAGKWSNPDKGTPISIYNLQNGKWFGNINEIREPNKLAFSPDGTLLLAGNENNVVRVIDFNKFRATKEADLKPLHDAVAKSASVENLRSRAAAYFDRGYFLEAEQDLNRLIKLSPKDADAYNKRAMARDEMSDLDGAISDYTKAIDLGGDKASLYALRSEVKFRAKDQNGAVADATLAIKIEPNNPQHYLLRAELYHDMQMPDKSLSDLALVKSLEPENNEVNFLIGDAYIQKKDLAKALEYYNITIKNNPKHLSAYYMKAMIFGERQDANGVMENVSAAIKIAEEEGIVKPDLYVRRGEAYNYKGDYSKALKDFATADRYGDVNGYVNVAYVRFFQLDDMDLGHIWNLQEALILDQDNKRAKELLPKAEEMHTAYNRSKGDTGSRTSYSYGTYGTYGGSSSSGYSAQSGSNNSSSYSRSSSSSSYYSSTSANNAARYQEQRRLDQNNANRQQIENKLWNMNNPYNRR